MQIAYSLEVLCSVMQNSVRFQVDSNSNSKFTRIQHKFYF